MGPCLLGIRENIIISQNLGPFDIRIVELCLKTSLAGFPVSAGLPVTYVIGYYEVKLVLNYLSDLSLYGWRKNTYCNYTIVRVCIYTDKKNKIKKYMAQLGFELQVSRLIPHAHLACGTVVLSSRRPNH